MFLSLTNDLELNEARPLAQYNNLRFLLNSNGTYKLGSNVCPHQASKILSKQSNQLECQYHGWTWNAQGEPVSSGHTAVCNQKKLNLQPAYENQGMIFDSEIRLPQLPITFGNFHLEEHRTDRVKTVNPMHIMNIFLDVDHIPIVHKGVYEEMGITGEPNVEWEYFENGSVQKVYHSTEPNKLIFMWLAIYPFTMIEWQQGAMFITDCYNSENGISDVAVYKYRESGYNNYDRNQEVWETAWSQDKFQSEQMVAKTMNRQVLEIQKQHYLTWADNNDLRI